MISCLKVQALVSVCGCQRWLMISKAHPSGSRMDVSIENPPLSLGTSSCLASHWERQEMNKAFPVKARLSRDSFYNNTYGTVSLSLPGGLRYTMVGASSSVGIENTRRPVISCPSRVIPLSRSIFVGATTCHQTKGRSLGKVQWLALRIHASTSCRTESEMMSQHMRGERGIKEKERGKKYHFCFV